MFNYRSRAERGGLMHPNMRSQLMAFSGHPGRTGTGEFEKTFFWACPRLFVLFFQASGVDIDPDGDPVVFHRGDRKWEETTFDE